MPTRFQEKVYSLCQQIPKGRISTYGEIASALKLKAFQAIGQALRCNPYAPLVPCHRVVASDGTLGGFNGRRIGKEITKKRKLLEQEGISFIGNKISDFGTIIYQFKG